MARVLSVGEDRQPSTAVLPGGAALCRGLWRIGAGPTPAVDRGGGGVSVSGLATRGSPWERRESAGGAGGALLFLLLCDLLGSSHVRVAGALGVRFDPGGPARAGMRIRPTRRALPPTLGGHSVDRAWAPQPLLLHPLPVRARVVRGMDRGDSASATRGGPARPGATVGGCALVGSVGRFRLSRPVEPGFPARRARERLPCPGPGDLPPLFHELGLRRALVRAFCGPSDGGRGAGPGSPGHLVPAPERALEGPI